MLVSMTPLLFRLWLFRAFHYQGQQGSTRRLHGCGTYSLQCRYFVLPLCVKTLIKDGSRIDGTHPYPLNCGVIAQGLCKLWSCEGFKSSKVIIQMRTLSVYLWRIEALISCGPQKEAWLKSTETESRSLRKGTALDGLNICWCYVRVM